VIKAIIFDCFGVIRIDPTIMAYRQFGGNTEKDHEFIEDVLYASSTGKVSSVELFSQHLGIDKSKWLNALQTASSFDDDLLTYIKALRPEYKVGLLTNIGKGGLSRWFDPDMLEVYFDVSVASGDIGYAKPEAQAYEIIADRLDVRTDECIMVDDRELNCAGARAVGMQAIEYHSLEQFLRDAAALITS
jgi:HAD superfamily hydrolase (TIGR01509 family)